MTDLAFQPGWRPDPQDAGAQRWWDGADWSEHRRPAFGGATGAVGTASDTAADTATTSSARLRYADRERAMRRSNPLAHAGVVLGLLGFLINVYGVPGVLALVFSSAGLARGVALHRTGVRFSGTVAASIGIGLGAVATVLLAVRLLTP